MRKTLLRIIEGFFRVVAWCAVLYAFGVVGAGTLWLVGFFAP